MGESDTHVGRKPPVRKIDWRKVIAHVDSLPPGTAAYVGDLDQSIRTHIRNGRYAYIDPSKYTVWTRAIEGSRTKAKIFLMRKVDA
jgi:hypothetical protein